MERCFNYGGVVERGLGCWVVTLLSLWCGFASRLHSRVIVQGQGLLSMSARHVAPCCKHLVASTLLQAPCLLLAIGCTRSNSLTPCKVPQTASHLLSLTRSRPHLATHTRPHSLKLARYRAHQPEGVWRCVMTMSSGMMRAPSIQ